MKNNKMFRAAAICAAATFSTQGYAQELWKPGLQSAELDINVEGAVGEAVERNKTYGFGRIRVGALTMFNGSTPQDPPIYFTAGGTVQFSDISPVSIGAQGEIMHIGTGLWLQAGGFVDVMTPGPGLALSAGWSVLGAEAQYRFVDKDKEPDMPRADWVLYGKLRVPITIIMSAF